ncbi:MAG: 4Fe-4S binding protein [Thermodesulfobacteriota bacterium]
MEFDVLVIGAGVAGLKAVAELAADGLFSLVVEKGLFPGGQASHLPCKATDNCARCNACLLEETMADLAGRDQHRVLYRTTLTGLEKTDRGLRAVLHTAPLYLDPDKCTGCGLCYEKCPARGRAIKKAPVSLYGPAYGLDPEGCRHFQDGDCRTCAEVCPAGAIDLAGRAKDWTAEVKAVVAACGFTPFDPAQKPRYGHDLFPDVISALELDLMLRVTGELKKPSNGLIPDRVAFIQCVGSRDKSLGRDYCSRICCGYALRLAALIKHRRPETLVSLFYMDLQNTGRDFDRYYRKLKGQVEFIHGVPGEITAGEEDGLAAPFFNESTGRRETRVFDLVVLSIGLGPPEAGLLEVLGLAADEDGFFRDRPEEGIFVAGAASGPKNVAESAGSAVEAAARAAAWVKKR